MRKVSIFLLFTELMCMLMGCGGQPAEKVPDSRSCAPAPEQVSVSEPAPEKSARSAAVCMGAVSHPVHRVVQLGFMEKAEELGYEGHILGLEEGGMQEQYDCWLQGAREHDIGGAVCWVGGDSAYEFLKELHGMGVKTVATYFKHPYAEAKDIIDVNLYYDDIFGAINAADFIGQGLLERDVHSGSIGLTYNGPSAYFAENIEAFRTYVSVRYAEFTLLDTRYEGAEIEEAQKIAEALICEHPDMVAAFGATGSSALAWSAAKKATGRSDIFVFACDYTPLNLDILQQGDVDGLLVRPVYEAGYVGMELIDELLKGKIYHTDEKLWGQVLPMNIIYPGGEGNHDPARYAAMYARSAARFGS